MIQQTSLSAWSGIRPELGKRQSQVLAVLIHEGSLTNWQIAKRLGLPINSVTPRVHELRKLGLVVEDKIIIQETGRSAISWMAL